MYAKQVELESSFSFKIISYLFNPEFSRLKTDSGCAVQISTIELIESEDQTDVICGFNNVNGMTHFVVPNSVLALDEVSIPLQTANFKQNINLGNIVFPKKFVNTSPAICVEKFCTNKCTEKLVVAAEVNLMRRYKNVQLDKQIMFSANLIEVFLFDKEIDHAALQKVFYLDQDEKVVGMYFSSMTVFMFATNKRIVSFDIVQDRYSCYLSDSSRISDRIALRLDNEYIQLYSSSSREFDGIP